VATAATETAGCPSECPATGAPGGWRTGHWPVATRAG
jgi:hypothetical protein